MKTATTLALFAIGAILAFAVTAQPSWFSFHIAGWVLMATGLVGALLPRRGYGWLRRRLVLNPDGREREVSMPRVNRWLAPGGLMGLSSALNRGKQVTTAPVESETIEEYIEE
jgi:hypothetical protein